MNKEIAESEQELTPKDILDIIAPQHLGATPEEIFYNGYPEWVIDAMEEYALYCSRTSEKVSPLEGIVSVRDLKELIEMWKESSKIPAMVGESKEVIAAKNIVYAECCRELKRLIEGDKSVIEKI